MKIVTDIDIDTRIFHVMYTVSQTDGDNFVNSLFGHSVVFTSSIFGGGFLFFILVLFFWFFESYVVEVEIIL